MVNITSIGTDYFEVNGKRFAKIYQPLEQGTESVGIYNIHQTSQRALNSTRFDEFTINGISGFADKQAVVNALLPVVYRYNGEGSGSSVAQWGAIIGNIQNQTDLINLVTGNTPVQNEYADRAAMLADQANQTNGFWQFVTDSRSAQEVTDNVEAYSLYWQYLGLNNGLITDYREISATEVTLTNESSSWKTKQVKQKVDNVPVNDIVEEGLVFAATGGTSFITKIYFDADFSQALVGSSERYQAGDALYMRMYNRTKKKFLYGKLVATSAFSTVNSLTVIDFQDTIKEGDIDAEDFIQFEIPSIDNSGTGSGTNPNEEDIKGTAIYLDELDITVDDEIVVDLSAFTDCKIVCNGSDFELNDLANRPVQGKTITRNFEIEGVTGSEAIDVSGDWVVKGDIIDSSKINLISVKYTNYPVTGMSIIAYNVYKV